MFAGRSGETYAGLERVSQSVLMHGSPGWFGLRVESVSVLAGRCEKVARIAIG